MPNSDCCIWVIFEDILCTTFRLSLVYLYMVLKASEKACLFLSASLLKKRPLLFRKDGKLGTYSRYTLFHFI